MHPMNVTRGLAHPVPDGAGLPPLIVALAWTALLAAAYLWAATRGGLPVWRRAAFVTGLFTLTVTLLGPLHELNESLFSAHMVQHMLLTVVAPPLLIVGWPVRVFARRLPGTTARAFARATWRGPWRWLWQPVGAGALYNAAFLGWHAPALYEAAVVSPLLHELEHAAFLGTALLLWQALIGPAPRRLRPSTTTAALVLFATWMAGDLLGAAVTLAQRPIYPIYAVDCKPWDITPAFDQALGGAIMWAGGGALWALVLVGLIVAPYLRRPARRPLETAPSR